MDVLKIVVRHHLAEHIREDTLCRVDVDPIVVKSLVVQHFIDNFINDDDEQLSPQMDQVTTSNDEPYVSTYFLFSKFSLKCIHFV